MRSLQRFFSGTLAAGLIMTVALTFTACEVSGNGDLDGMWYMTRIDSLEQGVSVGVREHRMTWSFQGNILQFFNYDNSDSWKTVVMSRFSHSGGTLIVSDPFIYDRLGGDIPLTKDSTQYLLHHGINSMPDTFVVEKLNRGTLRISDHVLRMYFEKY